MRRYCDRCCVVARKLYMFIALIQLITRSQFSCYGRKAKLLYEVVGGWEFLGFTIRQRRELKLLLCGQASTEH